MSRFAEYDEEQWPNQGYMWEHNATLALKGKRGRRALAELRAALLALPEQRLISGALCTVGAVPRLTAEEQAYNATHPGASYHDLMIEDVRADIAAQGGEGVCAMGALLWYKQVKAGMDPAAAFETLPLIYGNDDGDGLDETASMGMAAGLTYVLAWQLAYRNDETYDACTPEERYTRFLAWIDQELATEPA